MNSQQKAKVLSSIRRLNKLINSIDVCDEESQALVIELTFIRDQLQD